MNNLSQHYKVLGLKPGTSEAEIEQSYRKLAAIWHPNNFAGDPRRRHEAEEKIKQLNIAHETLLAHLNPQCQLFQNYLFQTNQTAKAHILERRLSAEDCYKQGAQWLREGNYKEAVSGFTRAIRINPNYLDAYRARAFSLEQLGYQNRASADFDKVAALKQQTARNNSNNKHKHIYQTAQIAQTGVISPPQPIAQYQTSYPPAHPSTLTKVTCLAGKPDWKSGELNIN